MINATDLVVKFLTLFFLAATSQMAFKNRQWAAMMVTFGIWLTVLRTAILRITTIDVGAFSHSSHEFIKLIQTNLMSGNIVLLTDFIALIGTLFAFIMYSGSQRDIKN